MATVEGILQYRHVVSEMEEKETGRLPTFRAVESFAGLGL